MRKVILFGVLVSALVWSACQRGTSEVEAPPSGLEDGAAGGAASAPSADGAEEAGGEAASLEAVQSIAIVPADPHGEQDLEARIEDAFEGRLYGYEWSVDGERIAGVSGPNLSSSHFRKGSRVAVAVSPSVGEEFGPETRSDEIVIVNRPPDVQGADIVESDNERVVLQVRAVDPDDDALTYKLVSGPDGMSLDAATGRIDWRVPSNFAGPAVYQVQISDGEAEFLLDGKVESSVEQGVEERGEAEGADAGQAGGN